MDVTKISEINIKDLTTFQDAVMLQMLAKEDEFYKEVLRQVIKREPTFEDAKDITLAIHQNYPDQELISYKGKPFGRIIKGYKLADACTFQWTFEPNPTFKKQWHNLNA